MYNAPLPLKMLIKQNYKQKNVIKVSKDGDTTVGLQCLVQWHLDMSPQITNQRVHRRVLYKLSHVPP